MNMQYAQAVLAHEKALFDRLTATLMTVNHGDARPSVRVGAESAPRNGTVARPT